MKSHLQDSFPFLSSIAVLVSSKGGSHSCYLENLTEDSLTAGIRAAPRNSDAVSIRVQRSIDDEYDSLLQLHLVVV